MPENKKELFHMLLDVANGKKIDFKPIDPKKLENLGKVIAMDVNLVTNLFMMY